MTATTGARAGAAATVKPIKGRDSNGNRYESAEEMWREELQGDLYNSTSGWYGKSLKYWEGTPPTMDGVLGGMSHIHDVEIRASKRFIESIPDRGTGCALDCGAGIGRVSKHLLCGLYATVDIMEPVAHLLDQAREELKDFSIGEFIQASMETVSMPEKKYDVIVIQWAAIYLTDDDFVQFLQRCKAALTENGFVFFKENCTSSTQFHVDKEDSSVIRSQQQYRVIFEEAGMTVLKEEFQDEWPQDLFRVKMYALR